MHTGQHIVHHDIRVWSRGHIDGFHLRLSPHLRPVELEHAARNEVYSRISTLHWIRQLHLRTNPCGDSVKSDFRYWIFQASGADGTLECH